MRQDEAYFLDMLIAARSIKEYSGQITQIQFEQTRLYQSAVIRELQIIGETARQISDESQIAHPEIPWRKLAGLRNRIIHEYFRVDLETIWQIIQEEVEPLIIELEKFVPPDH